MKRWRTDGFAGRYGLALALAALAWGLSAAVRAEQPSAAPSSFSPAKLERVSDYMRNEVATG
ncbi:MAG TPA: serine hydrolase, partial [Bradyrhizobium sp.]